MWRTLSLDQDGTIRGPDGAAVRVRDPGTVARAAARAAERPVVETKLLTGERVALAFEPGRVVLVPLPQHDDLDVDRLARIVSHDVRAPLRAIEAYSTFLAEDAGELTPSAEEDLGRLRGATARLRSYLDGLVDFLRAPRSPAGATCHVKDVTARLASRFRPAFAERSGTIVAEGEDAQVRVAAPVLEEQLARLIENILIHIEAPAAPHARIAVAPEGGRVRIDVADDGPGLAPEERARVVELFRRRGARQQGDHRAGAGLAIVKRAVEAWGGDLSVDAAPEGGVLVRIELPVVVPGAQSIAA